MRIVVASAAVAATLTFVVGTAVGGRAPNSEPLASVTSRATPHTSTAPRVTLSAAELSPVVKQYCRVCHNETNKDKAGNLSFEGFDVGAAAENVVVVEKMIRKLRAEMMPPPGMPRPSADTLLALVETLESTIDKSSRPNPGGRTFQRLNRAEYERSVRDLLNVEMSAGAYLPLDTKSANFDNIADVQALSPTLLEAYLTAAGAVANMAVGDKDAVPTLMLYTVSPFASQHPWNHVDGAPYGTRGGVVVTHAFPADGMYAFRLNIAGGVISYLEDVDISIDGERVALLHYERGIERALASADMPRGTDFLRTEPIFIRAGQKRVSAAFIRKAEGPYEDLVKPHDWSRAANGTASSGTTEMSQMLDMAITGPTQTAGVSETPSRKKIFSCRPTSSAEERPCAEQILRRLATEAYSRPLEGRDVDGLMKFYETGASKDGFEGGIRLALQAMLASPHFIFRIETTPSNVRAGRDFKVADADLASRLSYFLWGTLPDQELTNLAGQRKLSDKKVLEAQVRRMLADPRAEALSTRFAAQWLRLQDIEKVRPDAFWFPDYDQQLADGMRRETTMLFNDIVQNDRSMLDLFTADYTFVDERLARHYGFPNVSGNEFQRVTYPDDTRRGLLGHGSILVQTSLGNRTSPVLRGKWVMEVLLGTPPPPPPPGVPDLEETAESSDGRPLTTRERMEIHRKNIVCKTCHQYMDPIGLALDNFDVTGRWRFRENGMPLDTRGNMYDGTPVAKPADLTTSLLKRPIPLVRAFTENLMAYALGRRVEDYDQPTIRVIARDAEANGYRMSSFILGVVNSPAFQNKRAEATSTDNAPQR